MRGFVDKFTNSSGYSRALISALSTAGDRDDYWATGTQISVHVAALIGPVDVDLYVHMYAPVARGYQYITTRSSAGVGNDAVSGINSEPCPNLDYPGQRLFLLEVRGRDEAEDLGPWPYRLRISFGAK